MALECPHCGDTKLELMSPVTLHTFQEKDGTLKVAWDMMEEFYKDSDREPFRLEDYRQPDKWLLNNKDRIDLIICHSDKCEGRELTVKEIIDANELDYKNW